MEMSPLPELPGASDFADLLAREEIRRARTDESLVVAVVDLDGFRAANSEYGEVAGTLMLRHCAEALLRTLRASDEVARTGPDEFSVLLHATESGSAGAWAERFEDELELAGRLHPAAPLTCAVGVADTGEAASLPEAHSRARKRMEVIQTIRKLRRARGTSE